MPEKTGIFYLTDITFHKTVSFSQGCYIPEKNNPKGLKSIATGQKHSPYHFWQDGGGYDRNIISAHTIINVVRYIHNNPVRRELVASADQWYYSSAKDWQATGIGPIPIDFDNFPAS